jgi:hypothetical protein
VCDPVSLGVSSLLIGGAGTIAQFGQQQQAAERQNQYYEANKLAANQALVNSYAGEQNQMIEERNASSQQAMQGTLAAAQGRATATTAAGAAGVGGASVDALIGDYFSRESMNKSAINQNYAMKSDAIQAQELGDQSQAISRINSVQKAVAPSFLDAAIRLGGNAVSSAGTYYSMKNYSKPWSQNPNLGIGM